MMTASGRRGRDGVRARPDVAETANWPTPVHGKPTPESHAELAGPGSPPISWDPCRKTAQSAPRPPLVSLILAVAHNGRSASADRRVAEEYLLCRRGDESEPHVVQLAAP